MKLRNRVIPITTVIHHKHVHRRRTHDTKKIIPAPTPDPKPNPTPIPPLEIADLAHANRAEEIKIPSSQFMNSKGTDHFALISRLENELTFAVDCIEVLVADADRAEKEIAQLNDEKKALAENLEAEKARANNLETQNGRMREDLKTNLQIMNKYADMMRVCAEGSLANICYLTAYNMYQCIGIDARRFYENQQVTEAEKTVFLISTITKKKLMAHPDKHLQNTKQAADMFDHLNYLQSVLGDTERRARYNLLLAQFWAYERTGNHYVRTYIPHGGVYNTDRTIMNQYLDRRINIYIPTPSYLRSREQLPEYEPGIYINIDSPFM